MPRKGNRLLVVEDNKILGKALVAALLRRGFEVSISTTGAEALREVRLNPPDLLLLDLKLPDMAGTEILRQIKNDSTTEKIQVMIVSNSSVPFDHERATELGAVSYLVKANRSLAAMCQKIEAILEGPL